MRIAIVGLGLIGGSVALALKGFRGAEITGVDICAETREKALRRGAVSEAFDNAASGVRAADLVIFCLHPAQIVSSLKGAEFKHGAVITDVCGVKTGLGLRGLLPEHTDYVPCHPMAGKETGGFDNADAALFQGAGFIITPFENSKPESVELIKSLGEYMGAGAIEVCTPEKHDELIAYTSHLSHITAAAQCLDYPDGVSKAFMGGAFRDCTRVANIDPSLWTSLLLQNREHVLNEIIRFQTGVDTLKNAIEKSDGEALRGILEKAGMNKRGALSK